MRRFTVTENHLKLARHMYVGWQDCEFGAPEIDPKRPYGNSDVLGDIAELIGLEKLEDAEWSKEAEDMMNILHRQMEYVLQIGLSTGTFEIGDYEGQEYGNKWRKLS